MYYKKMYYYFFMQLVYENKGYYYYYYYLGGVDLEHDRKREPNCNLIINSIYVLFFYTVILFSSYNYKNANSPYIITLFIYQN